MDRKGLLVDTCALIAWANPADPLHGITKSYIEQAITEDVPLWISAISAAEFECKQAVTDLDQKTFIFASFEMPEAILAGRMFASLEGKDTGDDRVRLKADVMLVAHAEKLKVAGILTADANSLAKYCDRLRGLRHTSVVPVLTTEPFDPARVLDPTVMSLLSPSAVE